MVFQTPLLCDGGEMMKAIGLYLPKVIIEAIDDQVNPHDISEETQQIRKAIRFADDLLRLTEYAVCDPHYTLGNVEFHGIPCQEIFNETTVMVDEIFKEFWK